MKLKKKKLAALIGVAIMAWQFPALGQAQEDGEQDLTYELDQVVVTATKTEKKQKDAPAAVTVITAQQIKEANVNTIDEVLQLVPGVYVKPGRGMKNTTISIRGLRQNEILVLMDGLSLNNGSTGGAQWAGIPIENIERIEVVRGSFSALYGSNAIGGVINIITKSGGKPGGSVGVEFAQMKTRKYTFDYNGEAGKLKYFLNYANRKTDGYEAAINQASLGTRGKFGSDSEQYSLKLIYDFNDKERLTLYKGRADYEYFFDPGYNKGVRNTDYTNITYENKLSDDKKLNIRFGQLDYKDYWNLSYGTSPNVGTSYPVNPTKSWDIDINMNWQINEKNNLVFGIAQKDDKTNSTTYKLKNASLPSIDIERLLERSGGKATTKSIYLQDEMSVGEQTTLYLGARYDSWKLHSAYGEAYNAAGVPTVVDMPDKEESSFSPKIAVVHSFNDKLTGRVSAGKSFTAPGLFNLTRPWPKGSGTGILYNNPELEPETAKSYDMGLDYKISEKTIVRFTLFHNDINNMIQQYDTGSPNPSDSRWENIGKARARGFEFEIDQKFNNTVSGFFNYTYNDTKIVDFKDPSLNGNRLQTVPRETFNIGLRYNKDKITANLTGTYISDVYEDIANTNNTTNHHDPNFVVDAKVSYRINEHNEVSIYADNLFNRKYAQEYWAPGRCVGMQYRYKF